MISAADPRDALSGAIPTEPSVLGLTVPSESNRSSGERTFGRTPCAIWATGLEPAEWFADSPIGLAQRGSTRRFRDTIQSRRGGNRYSLGLDPSRFTSNATVSSSQPDSQ